MRARLAALAAERGHGVLADLIGYRPLALGGRVEVGERGARAVMAPLQRIELLPPLPPKLLLLFLKYVPPKAKRYCQSTQAKANAGSYIGITD
jgi:hypothetical protein